MTSVLQTLNRAFEDVLKKIVPANTALPSPQIHLAKDKKFGDYQSNVAMGLAKTLKKSPRDVATQIVTELALSDVIDKTEIAGPGFINLHIKADYLAQWLESVADDERLGVPQAVQKLHHIIDFSSPNLAKEMHVGHLRTTITGEVIARIIEFAGHSVERINHVGDWGTQFGMLLQQIFETSPECVANPNKFVVTDLEKFYKAAKKRFDDDLNFATKARENVVLLQSGDETAHKLWQAFVKESLRHCHALYKILGVSLKDLGESFYNERLPEVVAELLTQKVAVKDDGAVCVFMEGYTNREGDPLPIIVQKSDGGYNYATTDLAALQYRVSDCKGQRLIYITDLRQAQHFEMVFSLARRMGWATDAVALHHIGYGMVLGTDRKPFKTRDGGTVRLKDLIDESIKRAEAMVISNQKEGTRQFGAQQVASISKAVGLAAIKYADLSHNLASDYVFNWDQMLAMEGNTGPYMLYAYTRVMGIGRKAGLDLKKRPAGAKLILTHVSELDLAKTLVRFADVVHDVSQQLKPNILTDYLYQLSKAFNTFYDKQQGVSVLEAKTEALKQSRLLLCYLTARTIKLGLHLLSIDVVDEM